MAIDTITTAITEQGGKLIGPYRRPRNIARNERGSIHDDATATRLGFGGGTVAGSMHMEQFPPILVRAFGQRWWETGSLSCYFRNATIDNEAVRAIVDVPQADGDDAQVNVWMERDDGMHVLEGTASIGVPAEPSLLRRKLAEPREEGERRILARVSPGAEIEPVRTTLTAETSKPRLAVVTEPSDWYTGPSPWGGAIVNPGLLVHLMVAAQRNMGLPGGAVGLYGAIEIHHINGPAFAGKEYEINARILQLGTTPKTEYLWFETLMTDPVGRKPVAEMLMMLRFMKASSSLWS
jgi:hypothetical protein